jgi:hypothetical protein
MPDTDAEITHLNSVIEPVAAAASPNSASFGQWFARLGRQ